MELKRVDPVSIGKILGVLYAILGLFVAVIFAFISFMGVFFRSHEMGSSVFGAMFGIGSIIFFPLLYGGMGFIFGLLGSFIYNTIAKSIGGIKIELE